MQHMEWIHQKPIRKKCRIDGNEDVTERSEALKRHRHTTQKGAIKSGFNNFKFQPSQQHFYAWLILGYNNSQFEGENKVISRFITIEIQRAQKKISEGEREMNAEAIFNNIFSVHHI